MPGDLEPDDPELDVSSLIDVCFLLLIYFLVTTTIVMQEMDLDFGMSGPGLVSESPSAPLIIRLDANGRITLNPNHFPEVVGEAGGGKELPILIERLEMLKAGRGESAPVILSLDDQVDYQRVVDLFNCLAQCGVRRAGIINL